MLNLKFFIGVAAITCLFAVQGHATPINGSLPQVDISASQNSTNLMTSSQFNAAFAFTSGVGVNDFAPIPLLTVFNLTTLDLTNFSTFSFTNTAYGTFTASGGSIVNQSSSFLDVKLTGTYTPGPGLPGFTATAATVNLDLTQNGSSLTGGFVLSTVPEPSTVGLLTLGALGLVARRRRA